MAEWHGVHGLSAEDEAYRYIEQAIRSGRYRAGHRLIAEEIAGDIGTSRMPVREAFRRLAAEGLLLIRANRGAIVRGLDAAEMHEVFETRAVLEGLAAGIAATRMTKKDVATLRHLLERMESVNDDASEWVTRHREFHEYLSELAAMPRLQRQISSLHSIIEPYMRIWLEHGDKPMTSRQFHEEIVTAVESGDREAVEQIVREHVRATIGPLVELVR
ncbi:GntR family transcriptional regulator [Caballeronia megalochromosomata]|nr:GntR family transcriptional regulator [Caballeronia megalochromosomata]